MGVELARQICKAMRWDLNNVLYFTDSTTVLWWLRTHRELDVFVGNRVCRILDGSRVEQWYHVKTDDNPADIPTRGMSGKKLAGCKLWWQGPSFWRSQRLFGLASLRWSKPGKVTRGIARKRKGELRIG